MRATVAFSTVPAAANLGETVCCTTLSAAPAPLQELPSHRPVTPPPTSPARPRCDHSTPLHPAPTGQDQGPRRRARHHLGAARHGPRQGRSARQPCVTLTTNGLHIILGTDACRCVGPGPGPLRVGCCWRSPCVCAQCAGHGRPSSWDAPPTPFHKSRTRTEHVCAPCACVAAVCRSPRTPSSLTWALTRSTR